MPGNIPAARQVQIVRDLLQQTRDGKVRWEATEKPAVIRSVRSQAIAVLDLTGTPPRIRLRFSILGCRGEDTIIEQAAPGSQRARESALDELLAVVWQEAIGQTQHPPSAADLFLHDARL